MKKILAIALTTVLTAMSANAQTEEFEPNWFVQLQGGVQMPYTPGDHLKDLLSPAFGVNIGRNITPLVSARLGIEGWKSKVFNAYNSADKESFKYATGSFDAMLNVTNIWAENYNHPVNFYVLGGVGCNWSGMETTNSTHFSPNVRLGAQLDWRVCRAIDLNLEYRADNTSDQFNGRLEQGSHDWYSTILLGINFNFGYKKAAKPVAEPVTTTNTYDQAAAEAEAARAAAKKAAAEEAARAAAAKKAAAETAAKAAKKVVDEPLKETVYFKINASDPENDPALDKVVSWCNKYPSKKVTVSGYADKGTGTAKINKRISQKRAAKVVEALKAKGISADRISSDAYGDTVQPYTQNDDNRCTIVVGE